MMGKTHFKIGILSYCILITAPFFAFLPYIYRTNRLSMMNILIAGIAALLPDADSQHSLINVHNPAVGVTKYVLGLMETVMERLVRLAFSLCLGVILIRYNNSFNFHSLAPTVISALGTVLIILGIISSNDKWIKKIPFIGHLYFSILSGNRKLFNAIKRVVMALIYGGAGLGIMIYNYYTSGDLITYIIGMVLIGVTTFPHRTFLHSIEGFVMMNISVAYLGKQLGYEQIFVPFFIGYFSHLYLADIFTKEGVPLSIIPRILRKLGLHKKLRKNRLYKVIYKALNINLRVPIMSTGTKAGNKIEAAYTLILLGVFIVVFLKFPGTIGL